MTKRNEQAETRGDGPSYQIVRFYFDKPREIIETDLTLAEARKHCNDPETSSHSTGPGAWFDGYEEMP